MITFAYFTHGMILAFVAMYIYSPDEFERPFGVAGQSPQPSSGGLDLRLVSVAHLSIAFAATGLILDLFYNSATQKLFWLVLDVALLAASVSVFIAALRDNVFLPIRKVSQIVRSSFGFHGAAIKYLFSRGVHTLTGQPSGPPAFVKIPDSFSQLPRSAGQAQAFPISGACVECGSTKHLVTKKRNDCVRWSKSSLVIVFGVTLLGVGVDHMSTSFDQMLRNPRLEPGTYRTSGGYWFATCGFFAAAVVCYLTAAKRYLTVEYSVCRRHDAPSQSRPSAFVLNDAVYLERGRAANVDGANCNHCGTPLASRVDFASGFDPSSCGPQVICVRCSPTPCMVQNCAEHASAVVRHSFRIGEGAISRRVENDLWVCSIHQGDVEREQIEETFDARMGATAIVGALAIVVLAMGGFPWRWGLTTEIVMGVSFWLLAIKKREALSRLAGTLTLGSQIEKREKYLTTADGTQPGSNPDISWSGTLLEL